MTKMFRDRTIEKRVMAVVRSAIESAQKEHEEAVERAEMDLEATIAQANQAHEDRVAAIADEGVRKVFVGLTA